MSWFIEDLELKQIWDWVRHQELIFPLSNPETLKLNKNLDQASRQAENLLHT